MVSCLEKDSKTNATINTFLLHCNKTNPQACVPNNDSDHLGPSPESDQRSLPAGNKLVEAMMWMHRDKIYHTGQMSMLLREFAGHTFTEKLKNLTISSIHILLSYQYAYFDISA